MTNSPRPASPPDAPLIRVPGSVAGYFIAGPFFVALGSVFAGVEVNDPLVPHLIGAILLAFGFAFVAAALVLVGVRQIAQQQVDLLARADRDRHDTSIGR